MPEVNDKPKKTPTKKKTIKKQPPQEPTPESNSSSDAEEEYGQPEPAAAAPQVQAAPQAQQALKSSPSPGQLPGGIRDPVDDVALQPLRERKHMISQTIGEQHMKEIQDKRDKEGDEKQSLKIKISLDLDVEVHLSARVKGDITIGLL